MFCQQCGSSNGAELSTEMVIHFPGLKNMDLPGVWVHSKLLVCLDCGDSHLKILDKELAAVVKNIQANTSSTLQ
jgi:hypothetical protein